MTNIHAQPGLEENDGQFWLLMLMTGFVGAMVGLERAVIPTLAEGVFGLNRLCKSKKPGSGNCSRHYING